jgi:hypothetical protein
MALLPHDRVPLSERRAERLAEITDLTAKELAGSSIADLADRLRPTLPFPWFRRVCGQVVEKDPVTGVDYPVPYATVHVDDTDCSFLGLFPVEAPWAWLFPVFCGTEEIASVRADECGRFCAWIPLFDIDWIMRFRLERECYLDVFRRPSILDILDHLIYDVELPPRPPGPLPDPLPDVLSDGGLTLRQVENLLGHDTAALLVRSQLGRSFGGSTVERRELLDAAAPLNMAPPISHGLETLLDEAKDSRDPQHALAERLNLPSERFEALRLDRFIGPFFRCRDVIVAEFVPRLDIPDITLRVTQDVDGDGIEETIYSEGFFDVRWNAGPIPPVKLYASPLAVSTTACGTPNPVPCDARSIYAIGLMPVQDPPAPADPYLDGTPSSSSEGYARRPNRPHPGGTIPEVPPPHTLSTSPFAGTLMLWGCTDAPGAAYYRILHDFNGGPSVPFVGLAWPLFPIGGGPTTWVSSDPSGWYAIRPPNDGYFPSRDLLLTWSTGQEGLYRINVELADTGKNSLGVSAMAVPIHVDNSLPTSRFLSLGWRPAGAGSFAPLPLQCPVIRRPSGQDIDIQVAYEASATHFRSVRLSAGGCGLQGSSPLYVSGSNEHWYTTAADNYFSNVAAPAVYRVLGTFGGMNIEGSVAFMLSVVGRAFRPDDAGGFAVDWDPWNPVISYATPSINVAVVNA